MMKIPEVKNKVLADSRVRAEYDLLFGRYGFDGPEDPEEFCLEVSQMLTSYLPSHPGPSKT
ncbi:MAG: hypothetical protein U5L00_21015 [Desulfovermiculus sp.]|nr:hypothetical protein [Desulfovermiculus sp.]